MLVESSNMVRWSLRCVRLLTLNGNSFRGILDFCDFFSSVRLFAFFVSWKNESLRFVKKSSLKKVLEKAQYCNFNLKFVFRRFDLCEFDAHIAYYAQNKNYGVVGLGVWEGGSGGWYFTYRFLIEIRSVCSKYQELINFQKVCSFSPPPLRFFEFWPRRQRIKNLKKIYVN